MSIAYMDHEDLPKARKASIISSASLIVLQHATIIGDKIMLLGLTVKFDQPTVQTVLFWVMIAYFTAFLFLLRSLATRRACNYRRRISEFNQ